MIVLASAPEGKPVLVAAVSQDLVDRGLHAGELVKEAARHVGGGGGGKPTLAQAGGKDASRPERGVGGRRPVGGIPPALKRARSSKVKPCGDRGE